MVDVLAAGDLNVDLILTGLTGLPELGREVLAEGMALSMGGSTPNTACACAALGLKVAFFGRVGDDAYGRVAADRLHHYGVDLSLLRQSASLRTGITVSLSTGGDRAMATWFGDSIGGFSADEIDLGVLPVHHLHVGGYAIQPRLQPGLAALFRHARALGMTTSLDPGWDDAERWGDDIWGVLAETDYFFPNDQEAMAIAGIADPVGAARRLAQIRCTAVVKLGSEGSIACAPDGTMYRAAGYRVTPVDTTGAGDSFNAGFLRALLDGRDMETCLKYGNACGAVCVTRVGGAEHCATLDELERLIEGGSL